VSASREDDILDLSLSIASETGFPLLTTEIVSHVGGRAGTVVCLVREIGVLSSS